MCADSSQDHVYIEVAGASSPPKFQMPYFCMIIGGIFAVVTLLRVAILNFDICASAADSDRATSLLRFNVTKDSESNGNARATDFHKFDQGPSGPDYAEVETKNRMEDTGGGEKMCGFTMGRSKIIVSALWDAVWYKFKEAFAAAPLPSASREGAPPPLGGFISQCENWAGGLGENPIFNNPGELVQAGWGPYFELVYGEVPKTRYPICIGSFWFLNRNAMELVGLTTPPVLKDSLKERCPMKPGDVYDTNNKYQPPWSSWIYHPQPFGVKSGLTGHRGFGLPSNTWVEVSHMKQSRETAGSWFMFSMGSGIWFNTGKTIVLNDHFAAQDFFCGKCDGGSSFSLLVGEPEKDAQMSAAAAAQGYTTIQFLQHADRQWGCSGSWKALSPKSALTIEIVGVTLTGNGGPCGTDAGGNFKVLLTRVSKVVLFSVSVNE